MLCWGISHQLSLSITYEMLLLRNSTLRSADTPMILLCTQKICLIHSPVGSLPLLSQLISFTLTESNFYFDSSFATIISEPALYGLVTFHVSNFTSSSLLLDRLLQESTQIGGRLRHFVTRLLFKFCLLTPRPTTMLEYLQFSDAHDCLYNVFPPILRSWMLNCSQRSELFYFSIVISRGLRVY
jgi:hypothetical protein